MTQRSSTDGKAVVDTSHHWKPVDVDTPRGQKCLVINRRAGSAEVGKVSTKETFWTHYYPLPTFAD